MMASIMKALSMKRYALLPLSAGGGSFSFVFSFKGAVFLSGASLDGDSMVGDSPRLFSSASRMSYPYKCCF